MNESEVNEKQSEVNEKPTADHAGEICVGDVVTVRAGTDVIGTMGQTLLEAATDMRVIYTRQENGRQIAVSVETPDGGWAEIPLSTVESVTASLETATSASHSRATTATQIADINNAIQALATRIEALENK